MRRDRLLRVGVLGGSSCLLAAACFTGCGGSAKKDVRPTDDAAGEAGAPTAGASGHAGAGGRAGEAGEAGAGEIVAGSSGRAGEAGSSVGEGGAAGSIDSGDEGGAAGTEEAAGAAGAEPTCAAPNVTGSHLLLEFATANPERVTSLKWIESATLTTPNLIGEGGPESCGDPIEFFGQAYGAESTTPAPVLAGHVASLERCGSDIIISSLGANDCNGAAQFPVTTRYTQYSGAKADQVRVTRTLTLGPTPVYPQSVLRAFVPRTTLSGFTSVVYPNQASTAITTANVYTCPNDTVTGCTIPVGTTWNGRWFAHVDATSGRALIVLRDAAPMLPATLAINYDSYSNANLTAFMLQASDGWPSPLVETEYLCLADLTTWPQAARDAATLPAGCDP